MSEHLITTAMQAHYRNRTGNSLNQLVLYVDPNRVPGVFTLHDVHGTGETEISGYTLTGPRLDVDLAAPLLPECSAALSLNFTLKVLPLAEARLTYLGYTDRQMNLGHWLPQFPPYLNDQWFIPRAWTIGEYWVDDLADYDARVTLKNGADAIIIGPGIEQRVSADVWRFNLTRARSFTLAISNAMTKSSVTTSKGLRIDLYTFSKGQPIGAVDQAVQTAQATAEQFTDLLGSLPLSRLVVIEADFPDGMEFSGMAYVGHKWFQQYEGRPDSWLTLITAHEVIHQWWYSLVANDQNEAPYLDETLAIYGELLFIEKHYPELVPWWWTLRVKVHQPQGFVDSRADEYSSGRLYINAVYLRGATMLQEIRDTIGDQDFISWLQQYTAENKFRIATAADFWRAMPANDYAITEPIRVRYMRQPDPLGSMTPTPAG
ncbi:MAG: hypothetical protein KF726_00115 [Anaerolineae bacterium]|nr:hypothetical protein [Anaerolineae bacterium]